MVTLTPTPKDTLLEDGPASLYRFRPDPSAPEAPEDALPLLLVPSMINRWYVLDPPLVASGLDVWCLDWGIAQDEDRYFTWDDVIARLARAVRKVLRVTGAPRVGLLGYCMGATVTSIYAALHPDKVAAFVNLAGPIDFSEGGFLSQSTNPEWFDVEAISEAGNVAPSQMQMGFVSMRPTAQIAKWVGLADRWSQPGFLDSFEALETWANDNIPFPAAAYRTYIKELYQENRLVKGQHYVWGRKVDLADITCPVLTVVTKRDTICPPPAAKALTELCSAKDNDVLTIPGGHVGGVIGSKARTILYPALVDWFTTRLTPTPIAPVKATA